MMTSAKKGVNALVEGLRDGDECENALKRACRKCGRRTTSAEIVGSVLVVSRWKHLLLKTFLFRSPDVTLNSVISTRGLR